jgi:hypothetical protein
MKTFALLVLLYGPVIAQTQATGKAETKGACSPANTGNNNTFNITCQGIPEKLGAQLIDLLNRVAKNQSDAEAILGKLDGCLQGVKEVREQQTPWTLTDGQKADLKRILQGTKAKVEVHVIPQDRNASLLGIDLMSVLKDSGWDLSGPGGYTNDFTLSPALVGVLLIVNHADFPEAARLQAALHAIGIEAVGVIDDAHSRLRKEDVDVIFIAIGAKPPASK